MSTSREDRHAEPQAGQHPLSAEEANRRAAAERALRFGAAAFAEDRRRRPGTPANRQEGPA